MWCGCISMETGGIMTDEKMNSFIQDCKKYVFEQYNLNDMKDEQLEEEI